MRKALVLVGALGLAFGVSYAGEFHFGETLTCSQCHTMHASLQHSYGGSTSGYPRTYEPTEHLLKGPVNETCLACHNDRSFAPDVLEEDTGPMRANRSAGGLNQVDGAGGGGGGYHEWTGHTLGSTQTAPGDVGSFEPNATEGLECVNCHHQHGYPGFNTQDVAGNPLTNNFRNLVARNGLSVSYAVGTNDLTKDVYEVAGRSYETSEVFLNEPNPSNSGFGEWCQGCHVNFHGDVGDVNSIGGEGDPPEGFIRHPNATVNIGAHGGGHSSLGVFSNHAYRVRVMSPTGDWGPPDDVWAGAPGDLTPTCLSCHKGHGNQNAFGLIYAAGDNPLGEEGDGSGARDLCKQCHVQGG